MSTISDIFRLLTAPQPERAVPRSWLLRSPSSLDRAFKQKSRVAVSEVGDLAQVTINGEVFVWPRSASKDALLQIISELQTPEHPNQYLWGPTTISAGDTVFDIGACEGSFSARAAGIGARVIAVEPSRQMAQVLRKLFELRQLESPVLVNCLLGQSAGRLHFVEHPSNPGKSRVVQEPCPESRPIEVLTLDDLVSKLQLAKVDFIKCDAEGADVDIVKSGRKTLEKFRPKLAICTYHRDDHYIELHRFLSELGYRIRGKGFLHAPGKFRVVMLHAW